MKKSVLRKYAQLAVKAGINIQKGQDVIIVANVDQEDLVVCLVEECYKNKANSVEVRWQSDRCTKVAYKKASVKSLSYVPEWRIEKEKEINRRLPCLIYVESSDPDALKGVNQSKLAQVHKNIAPIFKPFRDERENKYQWLVIGAPSKAWAKKVFPELSPKQAVNKLWEAILKTSHADNDDPIAAWTKHDNDLKKRSTYLSSLNLDYLHYESSNGTNFKVWLIENSKFIAGGENALGSNIYFNPNIPTEECFTSPISGKAEGIVYSTKPLSYQGELIEDFSIRFKDGKAVEVHAKKGEELLKHMISMDAGACKLGEVALVPYDSPINNTGILFFNTLYDENAACHLALGLGFNNTLIGFEKMTKEEIRKKGINDSSIHVDFMIGSKDLNITGYTRDGKVVPIFKNGNWAFQLKIMKKCDICRVFLCNVNINYLRKRDESIF